MFIGVPVDGNNIAENCENCGLFNVFEVKEGNIIESFTIKKSGVKFNYLPEFLLSSNVDVIIVESMSKYGVKLFERVGIKVITEATGDVTETILKYISGDLEEK